MVEYFVEKGGHLGIGQDLVEDLVEDCDGDG